MESSDLDPTLYRLIYPDLRGLSDRQLRRHWARRGRIEGRVATQEQLEQLARSKGVDPIRFNPIAYLQANPDLPVDEATRYAALHHYVTTGIEEGRALVPDPTGSSSVSAVEETFVEGFMDSVQAVDIQDRIALLHYLVKRTSLSVTEVERLATRVNNGEESVAGLLSTWMREEAVHQQHFAERQDSVEHRDASMAALTDRPKVRVLSSSEFVDVSGWYQRLALL